MLDFRPILFVLGILLTALSIAMFLPALVDAASSNDDWQVFLASAGLTLFIGVSLFLAMRGGDMKIGIREAFVLTTASWLGLTFFAALPFMFAGLNLSFADAFFEAMSGITTTGSTVIIGLDTAPPGILLWRALLQWLGGIGIIVTAVAVLPMLRIGGMQIFRLDFAENVEKALPRVAQIVIGMFSIYIALTLACAAAYRWAGMSEFDALSHALTTIATGGFSTHDASLGYFKNPTIEWISTAFMLLSALPFILYVRMAHGSWHALYRDHQVRAFFGISGVAILMLWVVLIVDLDFGVEFAARSAAFNTISIITGTGYATADYDNWGPFAFSTFFVLMFVGGCAGSTACGIKIFRFQVLYAIARRQLRSLIRPHEVRIPVYNDQPITEEISLSVLSFFFFYIVLFALISVGLGLANVDFVTAISSSATAISNVGPGLGPIVGPAGTFTDLPDAAKWMLAAGMLLGRLELFTVLVILTPAFWRS